MNEIDHWIIKEIPLQIRLKLAKKAFLKTSQYDRKIFNFLTKNEKKRNS